MATVRGGKITSSSKVLSFNSKPNVIDNVETTVDTFTAARDEAITLIKVSGDGNGIWTVYVDTVKKFEMNGANGDRGDVLDFDSPWLLLDGETIDIKVIHQHTGDLITYKSTIMGVV